MLIKNQKNEKRNCSKLPPATDKHTTSPTIVPKMRQREDFCPYSRTEMTTKTITSSTIHYVFYENIGLYKRTCIVNSCRKRKRPNKINHTRNTALRREQIVFRVL